MPASYRFAVCNEIFQQTPFAEICRQASAIGYAGLELAPHTLADDATLLTAADRAELNRKVSDAGLEFVGLHWLLVSPPGLHITSPDEATRTRTWEYVHRAIDLCADLAGCKPSGNGVMVFGSPKQRSTNGTMHPRQARDVFTHELAHAAPHAESRGVTLLVEAIPSRETDVVNRISEAIAIVREIGSPAVQTMFDVHNSIDEVEGHAELISKFCSHLRHVHVNELDGKEPGMGDYSFETLLSALEKIGYDGWVSVEAFDFSRPAVEIARRALERLNAAAMRASVQQVS